MLILSSAAQAVVPTRNNRIPSHCLPMRASPCLHIRPASTGPSHRPGIVEQAQTSTGDNRRTAAATPLLGFCTDIGDQRCATIGAFLLATRQCPQTSPRAVP